MAVFSISWAPAQDARCLGCRAVGRRKRFVPAWVPAAGDQVKRTPVRGRSRSAVAERAATAGMAERRPREELSEGRQRLDGSSSALVPATVRPRNPLGKHNDWPDAGFAARKHRSPAQGRLRPCRRHQRPVPALAGPRRPPAPSPRPTRSHRRRRLGPGEAPLQSCVGPPRPG